MEIRKQISIPSKEVEKILLDHLEKQGHRINTLQRDSAGNFTALTLTEDEIYFADTEKILKKPLVSFELPSPKLKKKLIALSPENAMLGSILEYGLKSNEMDKFLKENSVKKSFFNDSRGENELTKQDEKILIETFAVLGIKLNKTKE